MEMGRDLGNVMREPILKHLLLLLLHAARVSAGNVAAQLKTMPSYILCCWTHPRG